ncbi:lyase family protein [Loktanella agnita]|uniref:lyase family protein n=1 Tax=Loktanella agnita TaxID=287097 RepID=UPI00398722C2
MTLSPLDSSLWQGLYGSAAAQDHLDDAALIRAMVTVEIALARACDASGITPEGSGEEIAKALAGVTIAPAVLAEGAVRDGVPIPALLAALRAKLDPSLAEALHWGATSQDIIDTATVLCLGRYADHMLSVTDAVIENIATLAEAEAETPHLARTRTQAAAPTTFGATVAIWGAGLAESRADIAIAAKGIATVSLYGAAGTGAALGTEENIVRAVLADELGLEAEHMPWHTRRTRISRFAAAVAAHAAQCGRIGADLAQLAASGTAEIRLSGGGSSAMPHKVNPVRAEAAQSLARLATHLQAAVSEAAIHPTQRDGAAWGLEWLALRSVCGAAMAALDNIALLIRDLTPDRDAMARNLAEAGPGVISEQLIYLLARQMPRSDARHLVTAALKSDDPIPALAADYPDIDWAKVTDMCAASGNAPKHARSFAAKHKRGMS